MGVDLSNSKIVSIDPGNQGAMTFWVNGELTDIVDIPLKNGKINWNILKDKILDFRGETKKFLLICERLGPRPGMAAKTIFQQGFFMGFIEALRASLGIVVITIPPVSWKNALGLSKDKKLSLEKARKLWPHMINKFELVKHNDRAESALIGYYSIETGFKVH